MRYSVIIPVYNLPDEVDELLQSLTQQSVKAVSYTHLSTMKDLLTRTNCLIHG